MSEKTKRQMTPDQLEKLKIARTKALAVRQEKAAKLSEIKQLEKQAAQKEIDEKLQEVRERAAPKPVIAESKIDTPPKMSKTKKKAAEVLKEVMQEDSSDSDDNSDDENIVDPLKEYMKAKYRQKYKQKYESKATHQLVKGTAVAHLKQKVNDEIYKIAAANIFGA